MYGRLQSGRPGHELSARGLEIAGTQNDLVWDSAQLDLVGFCEGPDLHAAIRESGRLRVLMLSLMDLSLRVDGGQYCCTFRVHPETPGCAAVAIVNVHASDAEGGVVPIAGIAAQICPAGATFTPCDAGDVGQ